MDHRQLVQNAYDGFPKGDADAFFGILDDDVDWNIAEGFPYGGRYLGLDAVKEVVMNGIGPDWEGEPNQPDYFFYDPEQTTVIVLGWYRLKNRANGKSCTARFTHVWQFGDHGKVVRFEQVVDSLMVQKAA